MNNDKKNLTIMTVVALTITFISLGFSFYFCSYARNNTGISTIENLTGLFKIKLPSIKFPKIKKIKISSKKYTITFDTKDTTKKINDQIVKYGKKIKKPAEIIKAGYKLAGWKYNGKYWNFKTKVTKDINLVAEYVPSRLNCIQDKRIKDANVNICVDGQILPSLKNESVRQMQNFAITDKYVYFSAALNGSWDKKYDDKFANAYIIRYDRKDFNSYKVFKFEHSGHSNGFDIRMETLKNGKKEDKIFLGNASYEYYSESLKMKGSSSRGITYMTLPQAQDYRKDELIKNLELESTIPQRTMFINDKSKKITLLDYKNESKTNYYKKLIAYGNNENYSPGEFSVKGDYIAYKSPGIIRVYDLDDMLRGKYTLYAEYKAPDAPKDEKFKGIKYGGGQGIAMTNRTITGDRKNLEVLKVSQVGTEIVIRKYNKQKEDLQGVARIDMKGRYGNASAFEAEGIKIYGDYIYFGVARKVSPRKNDILRVKYSDLNWKSK